MDIFSLINLIVTLSLMTGYGVVRVFGNKKPQQAIAAPKKKGTGHRLVKTYIGSGDSWIEGWRFLCSCGAKGCASNMEAATYSRTGKLGSEASAIEKFKIHRDAFLAANGDDDEEHGDTAKLRKLEAEFAEWRKVCYCKDTNDDLLLLKHRHLDSLPTTTVK